MEQLTRAKAFDLMVPDSIVTQDHDHFQNFWNSHSGQVVIKPLVSGYLEREGFGSSEKSLVQNSGLIRN